MTKIRCQQCGHENPAGARVCEQCYRRLPRLRPARGAGLLDRLSAVPLVDVLAVGLTIILVILTLFTRPGAAELRELVVQFSILGLLTLGCTLALTKGHYDLSSAPVAGLAAGCAVLASSIPGTAPAILVALLVGAVAGLLNGIIAAWTRIHTVLFSILVAAVAMELTDYMAHHHYLIVTDPFFQAIGEAEVLGLPVAVLMLPAAALGAFWLWRQQGFWPLASVSNRQWVSSLTQPRVILWAFVLSGLLSGIAGLLIAASALPVTSPIGHNTWILAPLAAALLGGGSGAIGRGGVRSALLGAASLALLNGVLRRFGIPLAGAPCEGIVVAGALLGDRMLTLTWHEFQQLRIGNVLALPETHRLPRVLFALPRLSKPVLIVGLLLTSIATYAYVGYYVVAYVPENSAVITTISGLVEVRRERATGFEQAHVGDILHAGDTLKVSMVSVATLRFSDGSRVKIHANTTLTLSTLKEEPEGKRTTEMYMRRGVLWAKVRKPPTADSSFVVDSPLLTVGVRGTEFLMRVTRTRASVEVVSGQVEATRKWFELDINRQRVPREERRRLRFGEGMIIGARRGVSGPPTPLSPERRQAIRELAEKTRVELLSAFRQVEFLRGLFAWIVLVLLLIYVIVTYGAPEVRAPTLREMTAAAAARMGPRARTAADSASAAALAQMYLQLGDTAGAVAELETIVEVDPDSEYGQWAQETLNRLRGTGPRPG